MTDIQESAAAIAKTGMLASEVLLPGASNLIAGNIGSGVLHLVATTLVVSALAPSWPLLAAAAAIGLRVNSYTQATTGESAAGEAFRSVNRAPA